MVTTQQKKKRIKNKLDKLIQQVYRKKGDKCMVCGSPAEVLHHFIQESQSMYLRWNKKNLIPLCNSCHCKHHLSGDPKVVGTIINKKGLKWFDEIQRERNMPFSNSLSNLQEILKKMESENGKEKVL